MKVLVVGGGGREHALAWKLARSPRIERVFVAPGNAGTAREANVANVSIGSEDLDALREFALRESVALTIVGPEAPLVEGIVDAFDAAGLRCFGPSKAAAQLEGSKAFTKDFLARHGIPTAEFGVFTAVQPALDYLREKDAPIVVKADGLAAGKGVILAQTQAEAEEAVRDMLAGNAFGEAGHRVVIEEYLVGEEASFIVMADGQHVLTMATSQDHKARYDGDRGPNTGGMGAYSPAPVVTPEIHERILEEVMRPTVAAMAAEGRPYKGFLYAGLMIGPDGAAKVLEFNCRLGDPETQPILLRLRSDLLVLCEAALEGQLHRVAADWDHRSALGVVMVAEGYPRPYRKGDPIGGLDDAAEPDVLVFHAGTEMRAGEVVTSGGRVLCVTALGNSVSEAQDRAYERATRLSWPGASYRTDIGHRAIARESAAR